MASEADQANRELSASERAIYEWQLNVAGFGEEGQQRLKNASVLVSRVGGLGGLVAYQLAAAGVGRLILAHAGNIKPSDLNRQLLMSHSRLGESRVEAARQRLIDLNPYVRITLISENPSPENAERLVAEADVVVDCAPLFEERFALNDAAVKLRKPMIECGMFDLEAQITTILPGQTPCLRCLYPSAPPTWTRKFPVFGAVSGSLGCMAAMEAIKVLAGIGKTLAGRLLIYNLRQMDFRTIEIQRQEDCAACSAVID